MSIFKYMNGKHMCKNQRPNLIVPTVHIHIPAHTYTPLHPLMALSLSLTSM